MHPEIVGSLARLPQCPVCGQRNQRWRASVREHLGRSDPERAGEPPVQLRGRTCSASHRGNDRPPGTSASCNSVDTLSVEWVVSLEWFIRAGPTSGCWSWTWPSPPTRSTLSSDLKRILRASVRRHRSAQVQRKWSVRSDPVKECLRGRAKSSSRLTLSARRTRIGLVCVGAPPVRGKGILPPKLVRGDFAEPSSSL
jgi:hypothetical protein